MDRSRLPRRLFAAALLIVSAIAGLVIMSRAYRVESAAIDQAATRLEEPLSRVARSSGGAPAGVADEALAAMFDARRLVRTASLSVEVASYAEAAERAVGIARANGGYLADSRASRESGGRQLGTLTLRVPAERFEGAFRELKGLGRVHAAAVETQDVTKQYADLSARLSAKRGARTRLSEILATRTADLSELVAAERELSRLVEEIEQLEGERIFYERQIALSTIAVELAEPRAFLQDAAFAPLAKALREALPLLAGSAAAMVYAAAAGLPWALAAFAIWKMRRRTSTRRLLRVPARS